MEIKELNSGELVTKAASMESGPKQRQASKPGRERLFV